MPNDPRWLTPEEIIELNEVVVADTGEPHLVRDWGLLAGAISRPENLYLYEDVDDLVTLGVRLMIAISMAHAFEQGNKRTGFAAAEIFFRLNRRILAAPDTEDLARMIVRVIEHKESEHSLVEYIRPYVRRPEQRSRIVTAMRKRAKLRRLLRRQTQE